MSGSTVSTPGEVPSAVRPGPVGELLAALPLVDHHCHGVFAESVDGRVTPPLERPGFDAHLNEGAAAGSGRSYLDSLLGLALRRWCPPLLDLDPHSDIETYLARRADLGTGEVSRRFLRAAGVGTFVVDTGYSPAGITSPAELAALAGDETATTAATTATATATDHPSGYEIVRLETLAEGVVTAGTTAAGFADAVRAELSRRVAAARGGPGTAGATSAGVVGAKSIAAYRVGLRLPGSAPTAGEVTAHAGRWLADTARERPGAGPRCADAVLSRFLVQTALEAGLPVQFHCGYGDVDIDLDAVDPVHLTPMLRATESLGVPVLLLHTYPFHRQAGYLSQVFTHVSTDLGLATHNTGTRSVAILAEALELVPFGDFLFSSDAFGLPELYLLGTLLFRRALGSFLDNGIRAGDWSAADGERVAHLIADQNARRVYGLPA